MLFIVMEFQDESVEGKNYIVDLETAALKPISSFINPHILLRRAGKL
jgi:hypothetical protein